MLAVVKTPHTEIKIRGEIPVRLIKILQDEFGKDLSLSTEADNQTVVSVFETPEYYDFKKKVKPGDYLRIYRENAGLTQAAFGKKVGLSRAFVCDLEHGRRQISKDLAKKLSAEFEVSVSRFI